MKFGFVKVASAVPRVKVADCMANVEEIKNLVVEANEKGVQIVLFPELALTGATCGDLLAQPLLQDAAEVALMQLLNDTRSMDVVAIVGMPLAMDDYLLNVAAVIQKGKVLGVVPKTILRGDDKRRFVSAAEVPFDTIGLCGQQVPVGNSLLFDTSEITFAIAFSADVQAPNSIADSLALQGAEILFVPAADNEVLGRYNYTTRHMAQQTATLLAGCVYASCGFGESTTDTAYAGNAFIMEKGKMLAQAERFGMESQLIISEIDVDLLRTLRRNTTTFADARKAVGAKAMRVAMPYLSQADAALTRTYNQLPFVPQGAALDERCREIFA
ncbi:MAG: NAD(+) synthase, partial [Bacteroides sp.]|nr:NAD(+) synthase [Bacteroides sp.]